MQLNSMCLLELIIENIINIMNLNSRQFVVKRISSSAKITFYPNYIYIYMGKSLKIDLISFCRIQIDFTKSSENGLANSFCEI